MAVLNKKEEKIQAVLGRLPKNYSQEDFVAMFIKLYGKDWGKIKAAYIKQSQDKEPGTIINMPKPNLYLKQLLDIFLTKAAASAPAEETKIAAKTSVAKKAVKEKSSIEKTEPITEKVEVKKPKKVAEKKEKATTDEVTATTKVPVKRKTAVKKTL